MEGICSILLWDLQAALAEGCKPKPGEELKTLSEQSPGEPLAGNWGRWQRVCVMQIKGDWSYYVEALGVWQWNCKSFMCPFCCAQRDGPYTWKDFSLDADWLTTCRTHEKFLADMTFCH